MARLGYLAIAWRAEGRDSVLAAAALRHRLDEEGAWSRLADYEGLQVWAGRGEALPHRTLPLEAGVVLGDLFCMPGVGYRLSPLSGPGSWPHDPHLLARGLCSAHWGRYVAIIAPSPQRALAIFRDPSGHWPALVWELADEVVVVASDLARVPAWLRPRRHALDWRRIERYVAAPSASTTEPLFADVDAVGPGEQLVRREQGGWTRHAIWQPADFIQDIGADPVEARREAVSRVDAATASLVESHAKLVVEISGGLDSAVVAGALTATGQAGKVAAWVNRRGARPEGDERSFARAVTDRLGVPLTAISKPMTPLTEQDFAEVARGTWPGMDGVDAAADRDDAARLREFAASALVSGHGGDAMFFQMPSALVLADAIRARGRRALFSPLAGAIARRTRRSVWDLYAEIRRDRRRREAAAPVSGFVSREVAWAHRDAIHAWVADAIARDAPPGKRLHIRVVANCQAYNGESRRRQVGDVLFPLMAQPVAEFCLALPTPLLAGAAYDRPFERRAFAHRVPAQILARRLKGDLTAYWSQLIAVSLPALRPLLLEGNLCAAGVLDRARVEQALHPDALIWTAYTREVLWAAVTEAWVRYWQTRVPDALHAQRWER